MRCPAIGSFLLAAAIVALATSMPATNGAAELRDYLPFGRTHRIARLLPTVVNITTHKLSTESGDSSAKNEPRVAEFDGSGFIIDPSGLIVTNEHVVDGALDIAVTLSDGTVLPAKLLGTGGTIDIALLKVTPPKPLPTVTWGNSDNVRVGDQVLAVGNPLGIGESVSSGIVSAKNRDVLGTPFDDFIQTDAAINHGNSGGPLVNMRDEVIGVNTSLYTPTPTSGSVGLGFAIPGNDARAAADQLRLYGHLRQGWLGVRAQDVTPNIADALGLPVPYGAIIVRVEPGGPGEHAGLQVGDVILKFGKQKPRDARALARIVAVAGIGDTDPLSVWRDGKEQTMTATVAEWPDEEASSSPAKPVRPVHTDPADLGLQTAAMTDALRAKYKLTPALKGAVITAVAPGTPGDESGLAPGDVIVRVQDTPVADPAEVLARFNDARQSKRRHVLVLVQGHDGLRWVPLFVQPAS
jgi:serine protease Do